MTTHKKAMLSREEKAQAKKKAAGKPPPWNGVCISTFYRLCISTSHGSFKIDVARNTEPLRNTERFSPVPGPVKIREGIPGTS